MSSEVVSAVVTSGLALVSVISVAALSMGNVRQRWRRAFVEWADLLAKLPEDSAARPHLQQFLDDATVEIVDRSRAALENKPLLGRLATRPFLTGWCVTFLVVVVGSWVVREASPSSPLAVPIFAFVAASLSTLLVWLVTHFPARYWRAAAGANQLGRDDNHVANAGSETR